MNEMVPFALALVFGCVIGAIYFWVLWRSSHLIVPSTTPWRAAIKGGGLRMTLLFGSFAILVLLGAHAAEILAWLLGFLLARLLAVNLTRQASDPTEENST